MLSLRKDLDPAFHIKLGKALAPLRDQGIAIVGSGMSFHDLRHFRDGDTTASAAFDAWLDETAKAPAPEREARLAQWDKAPSARECHPREEHLLPLMVVAGAAGDSQGNARLQRQDRRQDDLGFPVRIDLFLRHCCRILNARVMAMSAAPGAQTFRVLNMPVSLSLLAHEEDGAAVEPRSSPLRSSLELHRKAQISGSELEHSARGRIALLGVGA